MKKSLLISIIILVSTSCIFSQDKILRNNNTKIDCNIISIDNDEIIVTLKVREQVAQTSIPLQDVIQIIIDTQHLPTIAEDLSDKNLNKIRYRERKIPRLRKMMPSHGFFIEAGYTNLFINGNGHVYDEIFYITDSWYILNVIETASQIEISIQYFGGYGLADKAFGGIKPVIGYRFSRKLTFTLNYSHYFKQENTQSDTYVMTSYPFNSYSVSSSLLYTQRGLQFVFNYYPESLRGCYLAAGLEFMRLKLKTNDICRSTPVNEEFNSFSRKIEGSDLSTGFVFGLGNELPLFSSKLMLNTNLLYSINKYKGYQLFQKDTPGPVSNPRALADIKIGGFILNIGLRRYF